MNAVLDQDASRMQTFRELFVVADGTGQPPAQQPAPHRSSRAVHDRGKRRRVVARQRVGDLEVAARRGVEDQCVVMTLEAHRGHVRERAALRIAGVDDQRAGCADRERMILELER